MAETAMKASRSIKDVIGVKTLLGFYGIFDDSTKVWMAFEESRGSLANRRVVAVLNDNQSTGNGFIVVRVTFKGSQREWKSIRVHEVGIKYGQQVTRTHTGLLDGEH